MTVLACQALAGESSRLELVEVVFDKKRYHFVKDTLTGFIYNDNSKQALRLKCLLLIPRTLIDTIGRTIYHVAMCVIGFFKACNLFRLPLQTKTILKHSFCDVIRAPLYGLAAIAVAAYGIFKPYEGRVLYEGLERALNRQEGRVDWHSKYYIAPCFLPLNINMTDRNNLVQTAAILHNYATKSDKFRKRYCFDLCCRWTRLF